MAIKLPNRTGQAGVYHTGSPNYVDVDHTFLSSDGMVTFATKAADATQPGGVWANADTVGLLVVKDSSNWKVWYASWNSASEYLEVVTEEDSLGTISDGDAVVVTGTLTAEMLDQVFFTPQIYTVTGTTYTTLAAHKGWLIRCTSGSAVTITLDEDLPVGFHGIVVQEGAGTVSFAREGTDTINGAAANVSLAAQWKSAYFYQASAGAWVAVV